jgi:hypothetical protein
MLMTGGFFAFPISAVLMVRAWARKQGLDPTKTVKIAFAPTGNVKLWRKPRYQEILLPPPSRPSAAEGPAPETPQEYLRAIVNAAGKVSAPAADVGADAVSGARQLVAALEKLQKEIDALARDSASADTSGIVSRLEVLGPAAEGNSEERREMRQLLASQLDLAKRLAGQLDAARERHARMKGLLKTLWLQLADLRAQAAQEVLRDDEITGKIRAVCEDIEIHVAATDETVRVLKPNHG